MADAAADAQPDIARDLLRMDPTNIEAYVTLAEHAPTWAEAVALLREAIRIGNRRWSASANRGVQIEWATDREAASFIAAIVLYAAQLAAAGYAEEAQEAARTASDLAPHNQDARRVQELTATQIEFCRALIEDEEIGSPSAAGAARS
jgi:hypothetical protein